ncbi:adenylate/guanylate cyclase domain-containing protein [Falsiphaeobacter marinintestinus]|uniref:adenylate/guanylate cyclase domain-containing protein n=1 Tax=Falsiphaeobacter marinintestinus TaxID=1492905 RepID=UPI0011B62611|nr:adenylate/guanylate cyclase domain-containing protein [Phaeobacter marinintestinus]
MDRRLTTILAADLVGYSRLVAEDEEGIIRRLRALRKELIAPEIDAASGRIIKLLGDGLLAEFDSPVAAVRFALTVQDAIAKREAGLEANQMIFRIGINLGDIVAEQGDILGDAVNVAARIEPLATPGGICITRAVCDQLRGKVDARLTLVGPQKLKNLPDPVEVWRVERDTPIVIVNDVETQHPKNPSIVVLPFQNMSSDPDQSFFCDGLVEDIITALSRFPALFVIARNTAFTYQGKSVDVRSIGRELGVRYVLEGSVRRAGDRVRATAQLIDAVHDRHVWAEKYDRDLTDIFAIQDEITQAIVMAVAPEVTAAEMERVSLEPTDDLKAWEAFARASWHMRRFTEADNLTCQNILRGALTATPEYVPALGHLAMSYMFDALYSWNRPAGESTRKVIQYAKQAIRLDPNDPDALTLYALILGFQRRHAEAVRHVRAALEINPNSSFSHGILGMTLTWMHQFDQAEQHLSLAARLSPRDILLPIYLAHRGGIDWLERRYDASIDKYEQALRAGPGHPTPLRGLAVVLAEMGDLDRASTINGRIRKNLPNATVSSSARTMSFAYPEDEERYRAGLRLAGMPE